MEKKTMGEFIAILRRANGMTQKDLAEKLNVSDKAVSRWERDECAPDISLLPAIAELFGVTIDELVKGEKTAPFEEPSPYIERKSKKLTDMLVGKLKVRLWVQTIILIGVALTSLILALIFNYVYYPKIGFCIATALFIGTVATEIIFIIQGKTKIQYLAEEEIAILPLRKALLYGAEIVFSLVAVLFSFILPIASGHNYVSVTVDKWYFREVAPLCITVILISTAASLLFGYFKVGKRTKCTDLKLVLTAVVIVAWIASLFLIGIADSIVYNIFEARWYKERLEYSYMNLEEWSQDPALLAEVKKEICENYSASDDAGFTLDGFGNMAFTTITLNGTDYYVNIGVKRQVYDGEINISIIPTQNLTEEIILAAVKPYWIISVEDYRDIQQTYNSANTFMGIGFIVCTVGVSLLAVLLYVRKFKKINLKYSEADKLSR